MLCRYWFIDVGVAVAGAVVDSAEELLGAVVDSGAELLEEMAGCPGFWVPHPIVASATTHAIASAALRILAEKYCHRIVLEDLMDGGGA
ncbi:hypothetical protein [Mycobacteroides franklinii]|uniref:hypothetical protein n=1 Tax=Mycobacteroides franklinii TaxID=948102 RepID=UPI001F3F3C67|nr:hypothetical protein [Mycobacteroides franklinii]